ncbi:hypothetical protein V8F33_004136 [Rhypophila sp. PSN 637]
MATSTCQGPPNGALPDIKGVDTIPKDINVGMIGGSNISQPAMTTCCAPNKVQLLDGCYLWCKIPQTGGAPDIFQNFTSCLRGNGLDGSQNAAIGGNISNMGASGQVSFRVSILGLGLWAMVIVGVLM